VLRPLIGLDKLDIIETAVKIDTYYISILPYEDCCTVFLPKRPVTKPKRPSPKKKRPSLILKSLRKTP
jgi:thiamine biosynthesis protein ThiI